MITPLHTESKDLEALLSNAVTSLVSSWFSPAEIEAGAPLVSWQHVFATQEPTLVFVYKVAGRVVGAVGLDRDEIRGPFVAAGPRQRAVTQALLDHACETASHFGWASIAVRVTDRLTYAVVRQSGFAPDGQTSWQVGALEIPALQFRLSPAA